MDYRTALIGVRGVADVNVFGGEVAQLEIQVDLVQLHRFNLALDDIILAASQAGIVQGVGFIENRNQRIKLRGNWYSLLHQNNSKRLLSSGIRATISLWGKSPVSVMLLNPPSVQHKLAANKVLS